MSGSTLNKRKHNKAAESSLLTQITPNETKPKQATGRSISASPVGYPEGCQSSEADTVDTLRQHKEKEMDSIVGNL